ncbi:MAG TPA: PASTA domain-containing protein [Trueperaceae bacterium]
MPLLDGKYEVVGQRQLGVGRTHIDAIAPDGTPVRVEWFDLPAGEEAAFERYRRLLKRLKRDGRAAVHDVISRPGARYVAWLKPEQGLPRADDPELLGVLAENGYPAAAADIRGRGGRRLLYGLGFDGSAAAVEEAPPPRPRPLRAGARVQALEKASPVALSWALCGVLLLATALLSYGAFQRRVVDSAVTVPDVLGTDVRAAVERLSGLGLAVEVAAVPSEAEPGSVVDVDPSVGAELRPGRTVRLGYALAPGLVERTTVPALIGLDYPDEVRAALRDAGLELGEASRVPASAPDGVVLAQSVGEGSPLGAGQTVDVLVSAGPAPAMTFLPDLVGLAVEDARALAAVAGIDPGRVVVDEVTSASGFPGEVLSQAPSPHRPVPVQDTTLRLVVQAGAPPSAADGAPDLVGMTRARAEEVAAAAGWQVELRRVASRALPAGTVIAQSPPPLAAAEERSLLLVVNVHPVALRDPGVRAAVREPQPRGFDYAWTILPGIGTTTAQVYVTTLEGQRTLVATRRVTGGEVLRGTYRTTEPGPLTFELFLGGVPYGDPLLVP